MSMERELGIDRLDLPHSFEAVPNEDGRCKCGRAIAHDLHTRDPIERASVDGPSLVTEKGS